MDVRWSYREGKQWTEFQETDAIGIEQAYHKQLHSDPLEPLVQPLVSLAWTGGQSFFDFNSWHQYQIESFSDRRYIKRECFKPVTKDMLDCKKIQELLAPSIEQDNRSSIILNLLVRTLRDTIQPDQLYECGLFPKATNLGYRGHHHDVDIVLVLSDFDFRRMEEYKSCCVEVLTKAFPALQQVDSRGISCGHMIPQVWYRRTAPECVKLSFRLLDVDVVITGNLQANQFENPPHSYNATYYPDQDEEVRVAMAEYGDLLHCLIMLGTHWKRQFQWTSRGPTSCYIELLAIHTIKFDRFGVSKPRIIENVFRAFLERIMRRDVQVKSRSGFHFTVPETDHESFILHARQTHQQLWGTEQLDRDRPPQRNSLGAEV